jgi:dienelactone hydrolase
MSDLLRWSDVRSWMSERLEMRRHVWSLLGDLPPLFTPELTIDHTTPHEDCLIHHFAFDNGAGAQVYGLLLIPHKLQQPAPAMLVNHVHGHRYALGKNQLITPHHLHGHADGIELARRGFVVMGIDAYAFGERTHQGPAGEREHGADTEMSLFKQFLWQGRTLWGMMVRDDLLAFSALLARPEVNPERVGVTGMSMGGSRSTWLAAMDDRVQLTIVVSQMTRYADLLAVGGLNLHSIYYYVPAMLASRIDMEHLVALAAPRRQVILTGDSDPSSPIEGITTIQKYATEVYGLYHTAAHLEWHIYPGVTHSYTPEMHNTMIESAVRYLARR